jgi:hypothetical protein
MLDFQKDLDTFFNTNHFAQEFEVIGIGNIIKGIFQSPFLGMDMLGQMVNTEHTSLTIKSSDVVANNLKRKVRLRKMLDNSIWQIKEQQNDSTGVTTLILGEDIET